MATGGLHGHTSDEIFDFTCSPCAEQNRNKEAVKYCVECQDYYCQSCTDTHKMFPAMREHKLLNKTDFSPSNQPSLPPVPTERCYIHKTKLIDMFCEDHEEVCCTSCVAENHRPCYAVTSISDVIKNRRGREEEAGQLIQELNNLINACLEIKTSKETDMSKTNKAKERAFDEIVQERKELDSLLDQLEDASRKKVENEHKKLYDEFTEVKQRVTEYESRLQKRVTTLKVSGGNEAQRFVSEKLGHKDLVEITADANTISRGNITTFEYIRDPKLREVFSEMKSLGEVRGHKEYLRVPRKSLYKVKRTQAMDVKLPSDNAMCNIMSCCFDDMGYLLLTDTINKSLKRVNIQAQSVTDHCYIPDGPVGVCCVSKEEAAVSTDNKLIQFVSIKDHMKITRQIKLDHDCLGLVCYGVKMYVTDGGSKMYIHEISGKLNRIVEADYFLGNRHITYDKYYNKVYVADIVKGLISFDKHGEYISSYTDTISRTPQGVCTDGRGGVLVGVCGTKNVIQIGSDEQIIGEVVSASHGLGNIWSVCFDVLQSRLIVTTYSSNKIHMFELE